MPGADVMQFDDDNVNPHNRFGWKDLIGDVSPKTSGVGSPALTVFRDDVRWFAYAAGDDGDIVFHIPHDWAPGTDMFLHVHWAHNGTDISGTFDMRVHASFARGFSQGAASEFLADVEKHFVIPGLSIANTPRYQHRIDEMQISSRSGAGMLIGTDRIEVDGILLIHYDMDVIPTITGGTAKPFIFALDLHYQTDRLATRRKSPNFYDN